MTTTTFKTAIPLIGIIFTVDGNLLDCPGSIYCNNNHCPFDEGNDCTIGNSDTLTPRQLAYLQTRHPELLL